MRPVTLLSAAFVGLLCAVAPAGAAPPGDGTQGQAQEPLPQGPLPQGPLHAQPQAAPAAPAAGIARSQGQAARAQERRRRTSYASCNRESHRRKLSGGARRRFLVRCRLGYERRPASQPAPARRP